AGRGEVDRVLEAAAERERGGLPGDGDHRLVVQLGDVEAVQEMDRARPRRRHAHADLARELRVRASHERRHLLVPDLDEVHPVAGRIQRAEEAVDAVTRVTVDPADPPVVQALDDVVADGVGHEGTLRWRMTVAGPAIITARHVPAAYAMAPPDAMARSRLGRAARAAFVPRRSDGRSETAR